MSVPSRKILFITSFHPGAVGYIGAGEALSAQTLQRLRCASTQVNVVAIAPTYQRKNSAADDWCDTYTEIPMSRWTAAKGILRHFFSGALLAPWFFTRVSPATVLVLKEAIAQYKPTEIWLDFPSSLGFVQHIKNLPIHYFVHDVVSQKIFRSPLKRIFFPLTNYVEASLLRKVDCCYLLSQKDELLLRELKFNRATEVYEIEELYVGEVDGARPIEAVLREFGSGPNLVFFGNMGRSENSLSIAHFALFRWWQVRSAFPEARLFVIGLSPGPLLRLLGRIIPGLRITGAVDDPTLAFQSATVCIAPLLFGAGVKVKVLQMLNAGATVFSTPVGAEGIEQPSPYLIVASDKEIVMRLVSHLRTLIANHPGLYSQRGKRLRIHNK